MFPDAAKIVSGPDMKFAILTKISNRDLGSGDRGMENGVSVISSGVERRDLVRARRGLNRLRADYGFLQYHDFLPGYIRSLLKEIYPDMPEEQLPKALGLETDPRTSIAAEYGSYRTSREKVFAAGDARRGQSLVVWAIHEGRGAAREIDRMLMGDTAL